MNGIDYRCFEKSIYFHIPPIHLNSVESECRYLWQLHCNANRNLPILDPDCDCQRFDGIVEQKRERLGSQKRRSQS
jgi:hypothetical protein